MTDENVPWIPRETTGQGVLTLPQELYDEIMTLPDGADLSEYFYPEDSAWQILSVTLHKSDGDGPAVDCLSRLPFMGGPPAGAAPGTED